jgi:hypothetical protein
MMKPLSDRTLERYLLKELSAAERRRVEQALEEDETARTRLEELEQSNAAILERYRPSEMAAAIHSRLAAQSSENTVPFRARWGWVASAAAVAAVLLVVAFPVRQALLRDDATRMKGLDARIEVYRSGGSGSESLSEGDTAREGDLLQLSYVAGGAQHGVIFSIDGNGVVTYHFPETAAGEAPELVPSGEIPLAFSYELDDAPEFERFFFVTSQRPFSVAEIDQAARKLADDPTAASEGSLRLGRGLVQYSVTLKKGEKL